MARQFYPAIDGLRAVSFILVLFFHYNVVGFELGWAGVSVFFVISGFLITEILFNAKKTKNYFLNFYTRRALRIIPIYLLLLFGVVLFALFIKGKWPNDFFYFLTYTQNIFWFLNGYHSDSTALLAHTWSLAIEEQFYLIWPLVVFYVNSKFLPLVSFGLILGGVFFRIVVLFFSNNYLLTSITLFSQIDLLALGSLLATYKVGLLKIKSVKIPLFLFVFGIFGIFGVIYYMSCKYNVDLVTAYMFFKVPQKYALDVISVNIYFFVGLVSFSVIYFCIYSSKSFLFAKILSSKILIHLGKISYGLYLYHWPVYSLLYDRIHNQLLLILIGMTSTYILSIASFNFFEKRINSLKRYFE